MSHRNLCTNVYRSIIDNSPKAETTQMYISGRMDKQIVIYTASGTLFIHKKEWSTDTEYNVNELVNTMFNERKYEITYYVILFIWNV